ncbi:hypothetical protein VNO80_07273 [Phaseolus coccineus]|uniref:Uncharacterized protein n=1 Tax=Phaseolus coccineus TaxID=3886 RepID=A0AAN9NQA2_PHACN
MLLHPCLAIAVFYLLAAKLHCLGSTFHCLFGAVNNVRSHVLSTFSLTSHFLAVFSLSSHLLTECFLTSETFSLRVLHHGHPGLDVLTIVSWAILTEQQWTFSLISGTLYLARS